MLSSHLEPFCNFQARAARFAASFIAKAAASAIAAMLATNTWADQLTIDVTGLSKITGNLMVAVHNSPQTWDEGGDAAASARHSVTSGSARLVFADLLPGDYAVMLYHDENANGELDSNMLGVPSEGYGFSNNGGRFGRPSFDEAKVGINGDTRIQIEMR